MNQESGADFAAGARHFRESIRSKKVQNQSEHPEE
jgi:hypothetical protein